APRFRAGLQHVHGRGSAPAYWHHCDESDQVTDAPTIRSLRRVLTAYEPMLAWAVAPLGAYVDGGVDESALSVWRWHLQRLLASIGGVTADDPQAEPPSPLRGTEKPFERGTVPLRDARFDTFKNTGDYDTADGRERFPKDTY